MDIFDLLFFAGIIGFVIVKLILKTSKPSADTPGGMPEAWKEIKHDIPERQTTSPFLTFDLEEQVVQKKTPPKQPKKMKAVQPPTHEERMEIIDTTTEEENHLLEEARKGIVWSEILQRKY